ncbi:MAG: sugar phosphate isomerase/epimerase [Clostridiales bacterium]|nr:sugar phosphate isomerase/epimerase [Clostridiales bacterium]
MRKVITSTEIGAASKRIGEKKAIELVAKAGFDAYDFSLISNIVRYDYKTKVGVYADTPLSGSEYLKYVKELKKVAEDNGIFCNQSHAPFPSYVPFIQDHIKRAIECAAEAGAKICVVHPNNFKDAKENAEMFLELLPFAKAHGIKIATENMWDWNDEKDEASVAACSHHEDFLAHIKEVNDEYFVACLDIGHAEMKGLNTSAVQMIRTLGRHLQALHIHDNDKKHDSHWIPFSMQIDFDEILRALKEIDYQGDFTLECDAYMTECPDVGEGFKEIYGAVKKLADKYEQLT